MLNSACFIDILFHLLFYSGAFKYCGNSYLSDSSLFKEKCAGFWTYFEKMVHINEVAWKEIDVLYVQKHTEGKKRQFCAAVHVALPWPCHTALHSGTRFRVRATVIRSVSPYFIMVNYSSHLSLSPYCSKRHQSWLSVFGAARRKDVTNNTFICTAHLSQEDYVFWLSITWRRCQTVWDWWAGADHRFTHSSFFLHQKQQQQQPVLQLADAGIFVTESVLIQLERSSKDVHEQAPNTCYMRVFCMFSSKLTYYKTDTLRCRAVFYCMDSYRAILMLQKNWSMSWLPFNAKTAEGSGVY